MVPELGQFRGYESPMRDRADTGRITPYADSQRIRAGRQDGERSRRGLGARARLVRQLHRGSLIGRSVRLAALTALLTWQRRSVSPERLPGPARLFRKAPTPERPGLKAARAPASLGRLRSLPARHAPLTS